VSYSCKAYWKYVYPDGVGTYVALPDQVTQQDCFNMAHNWSLISGTQYPYVWYYWGSPQTYSNGEIIRWNGIEYNWQQSCSC
jgi:hypothetical protein